jgi:hypothetical protein
MDWFMSTDEPKGLDHPSSRRDTPPTMITEDLKGSITPRGFRNHPADHDHGSHKRDHHGKSPR